MNIKSLFVVAVVAMVALNVGCRRDLRSKQVANADQPAGRTSFAPSTGKMTGASSKESPTSVCWFDPRYTSTLVCDSRWFSGAAPASADLISWSGSSEVGLRINAPMQSDGNYYFPLGGHLLGVYRLFYVRANSSIYDTTGYPNFSTSWDLPLISAKGRSWLSCGGTGCDVRIKLNFDGTIQPAGDGSGIP